MKRPKRLSSLLSVFLVVFGNRRDPEKLGEMSSLLAAVLELKRIEEIKKVVASTIVDFDNERDSEKPGEMSPLLSAVLEFKEN